ncbi:peptidase C78, ubiquitin fold modifier-specific peptidase 1/ 2 [Tanacetum coccineum]
MTLLKNYLGTEPGGGTSILSGHVDHFRSIDFQDVGWGCGWRNIQMLILIFFSKGNTKARRSCLADVGSSPTSLHSKHGLNLHGTKDLIQLAQITLTATYLGNALGLVPPSALHFSVLLVFMLAL